MPSIDCVRRVPIERTARVRQLEGLFDVAPTQHSEVRWSAHLPIEERNWQIGLIVGPSGCGKTTLAGELFPTAAHADFAWPESQSIVDAFPAEMSIKEITALLSSVGFSSPPNWLRPFRVLSNGEQFRVTMARALAERPGLVVIDEFTSVIDRTVAQIGSAAVAKTVRRRGQQFVAVSCHYDIVDWLTPDWIYEPAAATFAWRYERQRRPPIELAIQRVHHSAWRLFKQHHYLNAALNAAAKCFVGSVNNQPATFTAVLPFPHPRRPGWREHRTVCLPDYQGVGIGNAMSDYVASLFLASGRPYFSTTSSPAMIRRRAASPLWIMKRKPSCRARSRGKTSSLPALARSSAGNRITAGFEYIGPARAREAHAWGVI